MARRKQYYWAKSVDDEHTGVLYHTEFNTEFVDPFFDSEEEADRYLERLAEENGQEQYQGAVLRDDRGRKVKEAVEVLMDQSGIQDFLG